MGKPDIMAVCQGVSAAPEVARMMEAIRLIGSMFMSSSLIDIESQALLLAPEERVCLADRLLASLSPDSALEAEWAEEAARRLAGIESGAVAAVPVEDAIARVRNAIR